MEDLLAELANDCNSDCSQKIMIEKFDTADEINAEFMPMGYSSRNDQVYIDDEVLDYY